jgi:hypothetical protein
MTATFFLCAILSNIGDSFDGLKENYGRPLFGQVKLWSMKMLAHPQFFLSWTRRFR